MIVEIAGQFINPEHVTHLERGDAEHTLIHLITGKFLRAYWEDGQHTLAAKINEAQILGAQELRIKRSG